jgi:hypothetical protein
MARERQTLTLALTMPRRFTWTTDDGEKEGFEFTSIQGEKFNCFDPALAKSFEDNDLAGKAKDYVVVLPERADKSPTIVEIVGLYKREGGSGWGRGGGGMTDRQAALMAASAVFSGSNPKGNYEAVAGKITGVAGLFLPWLSSSTAKASGAGDEAEAGEATGDSPAPDDNGEGDPAQKSDLKEMAASIWEEKPHLGVAFLASAAKKYGKKDVDELTPDQQAEIAAQLLAMQEADAEAEKVGK